MPEQSHLRRNPAYAFAVIVSLAAGIGANAAMFMLADAVLLRPIPVTKSVLATTHDVIRKLKAAGFIEVRSGKGSHMWFRHPTTGKEVWVAVTVHNPIVFETEASGAVSAYVPGLPVYAAAHVETVGRRNLVTNAPVEHHTIFRIAPMTKPVTTVAALMLHDEGRFDLDEPITSCAPEVARMRVLRNPDGALDETDEAARPITFRDLLTHRSGLTYGDFHRGPIGRAHAETLGATIDNPLTPDAWIERLATLPLIDQPGAGFHYGHSTDLLGFLLARLDGQARFRRPSWTTGVNQCRARCVLTTGRSPIQNMDNPRVIDPI